MRRILLSLALLALPVLTSVAAQQAPSLRLGAHVAGNMTNGPFDSYRVGGYILIPLGGRWEAYPAVSRFLKGIEGKWELSAAGRFRPLPSADYASPWYVGGGWTAINFGPQHEYYDVLLTGVEIPSGRIRPYVELRALDAINRLISSQAGVAWQLHSGLTWAVR